MSKLYSIDTAANTVAKTLKSLHIPGNPIIFANVSDILSAHAVASLPSSKALATASYGVARANGTTDDDMTLETNLAGCAGIAKVAKEFGKPLTVDAQDGYGDRLEEAVGRLIDIGVSGINLEDVDKETQKIHSREVAADRVRRAVDVAMYKGVPDFVVNARCDTLVHGGKIEEVIERGQAYLKAGATSVFVWGGSNRGVSRAEVEQMVKAFDGRLNISLAMGKPGHLTVKELSEIGVSRISVGPTLQFLAMETFANEAKKLLEGEY